MFGIVIVSHSERLARGVKELAGQMTQGKVPIEAAGGIDDPDNPIGTDPMKVLAAIEAVRAAGAGSVLVLMDLGSALMSAEAALEFLPQDVRAKVRLCAAPVVEGAVSAAVQACVGGSLDEAAAEAYAAIAAKRQQLAPMAGQPSAATAFTAGETGADAAEARLIIRNRIGLHARPAAKVVATAAKFASAITVFKGARSASARSINQLVTLAALRDDEIRVRAVGSDAAAAVAAVAALIAGNFGQQDEKAANAPIPDAAGSAAAPGDLVCGMPASGGAAVGPAHIHRPALPEIVTRTVDDAESEVGRLAAALDAARKEIGMLGSKAKRAGAADRAAFFEVHQLILGDPDLVEQAQTTIRRESLNAEAAWQQVVQATADRYRAQENPYIKTRAADVIDAGNRVLRLLSGRHAASLFLEAPAVIVAHDLLTSEAAQLDPEKVLGLVTATGGSSSHTAIMARSVGIPAVVGAGPAVFALAQGTVIGLDGDNGRIWLAPDETVRSELQARRAQWLEKRRRFKDAGHRPAVTSDGVTIHVTANIGLPEDAARAFGCGAEGVGLFRTEFLFQRQGTVAGEEEQFTAYVGAARAMNGHPVIIRTLDAGGDKALAGVTATGENNPVLGERGIRFCLAHPEVFKPQLRALVRAAQTENISILFPMVAQPAELRAARRLLDEARRELVQEGVVCDRPVDTGIMIEVPAAVAMAGQLAREADFFSVGSNDLTQYLMAADRGNAAVAYLCDSLHPVVLQMVHAAVQAGHGAGIPVGLCGELAGNPEAAPLLVGLGLDQLSMNAGSVPQVKAAIRKLSAAQCRNLVQKAMDQDDGDGVRQLLTDAGVRQLLTDAGVGSISNND